MDFRHEWKHEINLSDLIALRQRLRAVAKPDPHAVDGMYLIRGLYFDDHTGKALREKLDGVSLHCEDSAAIIVEQAKKVFLTLADGTGYFVSCGAADTVSAVSPETFLAVGISVLFLLAGLVIALKVRH